MEHYEETKQRAQASLPLWIRFVPDLTIGGKSSADLATYIAGFEPAVQARMVAQDGSDAAYRTVQSALMTMKVLGTKVPLLIEAQVNENESIMKDLDDLYAVAPRTETSILSRARMLHPVWVRANTALAALTPPQPPITRSIAGVVFTAAMLKSLLDGYTDLTNGAKAAGDLLEAKRLVLRTLDRTVDQLNKRWYKAMKGTFDAGSDAYEALDAVPTEGATPVPDAVEIATVTQGGTNGLQVLVAYEPGGGDHATTLLVKWQVVGVDSGFTHQAPLDASGNALGPFTVGQTVKVITEVSNSAGMRTTAVRTITLETPIT